MALKSVEQLEYLIEVKIAVFYHENINSLLKLTFQCTRPPDAPHLFPSTKKFQFFTKQLNEYCHFLYVHNK